MHKKSNFIVINGLNVTVTTNNIHIQDSWQIRKKKDKRPFLDKLEGIVGSQNNPFEHISRLMMICEWTTHNNLYKFGYKKQRTGSVDINYPKKWYMNILYFICGLIAL